MTKLVDEGHNDEETLGLLARTHKDAWEAEPDSSMRLEHLRESHRLYRKGFEHALAKESATAIATQVIEICHSKSNADSDYWTMATLGECYLILERLEDAAIHYRAALVSGSLSTGWTQFVLRSQVAWTRTEGGFGYSAAANGGDLLFLGAIEQRSGESHIVLPLNKELFVQLSVAGHSSHD